MTYDARHIANWFVERASRDKRRMSIMSLLKLTYIAHGWHLETRRAPLFGNRIEAWQYGPVIPDVYRDFRKQGIEVHKTVNSLPKVPVDKGTQAFLEEIWKIYGNLAPFQLSDLTHVDGGPWDIATQTGGWYAPIPDELIRQHYVAKRTEASKQVANG